MGGNLPPITVYRTLLLGLIIYSEKGILSSVGLVLQVPEQRRVVFLTSSSWLLHIWKCLPTTLIYWKRKRWLRVEEKQDLNSCFQKQSCPGTPSTPHPFFSPCSERGGENCSVLFPKGPRTTSSQWVWAVWEGIRAGCLWALTWWVHHYCQSKWHFCLQPQPWISEGGFLALWWAVLLGAVVALIRSVHKLLFQHCISHSVGLRWLLHKSKFSL